MALITALDDDSIRIVCEGLCNALEPRIAVAFGSASRGLRETTQELRQRLREQHEAATALCRKVGLRSCKELREAWRFDCFPDVSVLRHGSSTVFLSAVDLETLGTLGSVLPALKRLILATASPDGVRRLAEGLGAGALPAVDWLDLHGRRNWLDVHLGDACASALAAALGRGALPRLQYLRWRGAAISEAGLAALAPSLRRLRLLQLSYAAIGDAGLAALAPALRRQTALEKLELHGNPFGDDGLAALVPPPSPAGACTPPMEGLAKLKVLNLHGTKITNAGCAALAAALNGGALPAVERVSLEGTRSSFAVRFVVLNALLRRQSTTTHARIY